MKLLIIGIIFINIINIFKITSLSPFLIATLNSEKYLNSKSCNLYNGCFLLTKFKTYFPFVIDPEISKTSFMVMRYIYVFQTYILIFSTNQAENEELNESNFLYSIPIKTIKTPCFENTHLCNILEFRSEMNDLDIDFQPVSLLQENFANNYWKNCIILTNSLNFYPEQMNYVCHQEYNEIFKFKLIVSELIKESESNINGPLQLVFPKENLKKNVLFHLSNETLTIERVLETNLLNSTNITNNDLSQQNNILFFQNCEDVNNNMVIGPAFSLNKIKILPWNESETPSFGNKKDCFGIPYFNRSFQLNETRTTNQYFCVPNETFNMIINPNSKNANSLRAKEFVGEYYKFFRNCQLKKIQSNNENKENQKKYQKKQLLKILGSDILDFYINMAQINPKLDSKSCSQKNEFLSLYYVNLCLGKEECVELTNEIIDQNELCFNNGNDYNFNSFSNFYLMESFYDKKFEKHPPPPKDEDIQRAIRTLKMILKGFKVSKDEITISKDNSIVNNAKNSNYEELFKQKCIIENEDFTLYRRMGMLPFTVDEDLFSSYMEKN